MRVKVYANFEEALDPVIEFDRKIEVIIDYLIPDELPKPIPEDTIRFVVTIQPEQEFNRVIKENQDKFDYLLTFIPDLLILPKARFFIGLTNFCQPEPDLSKRFEVSMIFSGRNCLPGHRLRHELERRQNEIIIPKKFFYGSRSGMKGPLMLHPEKWRKRDAMFSMFHIAIDSYNYPNSFSEKLIDPLITKTKVVYWGPENISSFFNINSIIQVQSVDEIINICNHLTEKDYLQSLDAIDENYERGLKYTNYGEQLRIKIQEILNEGN